MNKETILEMVRSEIKYQANTNVFESLAHEAFDVFGYEEIVTEDVSVNPRIVKDLKKTRTIMLERGNERILAATNGREYEIVNLTSGERSSHTSGDWYNTIDTYKAEGFAVVKNKGAIARFLTKSLRAIATYIKRYGLVTLIGVAAVAAAIYFVGPHAVPFLASIAMRLGLGKFGGNGADVKIDGEGWVTPNVSKIEDAVNVVANTATGDPFVPELSDVQAKIAAATAAIPKLVAAGNYETANKYREKLLNLQDTEKSLISRGAAAASQAAQAAANFIKDVKADIGDLDAKIKSATQAVTTLSRQGDGELAKTYSAELVSLNKQRKLLQDLIK